LALDLRVPSAECLELGGGLGTLTPPHLSPREAIELCLALGARLAVVDTEPFGLHSMIRSDTLTRHDLHLQKSWLRLAKKADESEAQDDVPDKLDKACPNTPIKMADMGKTSHALECIRLLVNRPHMAGKIPDLDVHLPDWQIGPPQSRL
jgi:hypothetical protein